jgi:hypothetical protein
VVAPDPDPTQLIADDPGKNDITGKNACAFLAGGTLVGGSYTLTKGVGEQNDKHTYTFTYVIAPTASPVDKFTAWDLVSSVGDGSTAHVEISAAIAGESALNNGNNSKVGMKYSFDLGTTLSPRVQNVTISLDGALFAKPAGHRQFPGRFQLHYELRGGRVAIPCPAKRNARGSARS